ncbi:MAG: ABC transporter ATP-binding protein [Acidobacteriota bacterium]
MIQITSLSKTYDTGVVRVQALKSIDLDVEKGEFVAVMGPSGSGKSTLMNILGCLDRPTSGTYRLSGMDLHEMGEPDLAKIRNSKIGFVFQTFNLLPRMNALRNVEVPMLYGGIDPRERKRRATVALEQVGLQGHIKHRPNELSGGQRQRVAVARALVNNPDILLADEPTGNLDTRSGYDIMALFQDLHKRGSTIVLVTHEPEIAKHAQRIIYFRDGHLVKSEQVEKPLQAAEMLAYLPESQEELP